MSKERTAEEWGRLAVSLPGWRWMPGMRNGYALKGGRVRGVVDSGEFVETFRDDMTGSWVEQVSDSWPDPNDPATEGCMVRLLGPVHEAVWYTGDCGRWVVAVGDERRLYTSLGRACIAAAAALGRWPGGEG